MKVVAIIQARISSTRLPKKVLLPLGSKTVIENVHERVNRARLVDQTIIATTTDRADAELVELLNAKNIDTFRGSHEDVLDRYYQAAKHFKADVVVRITGDCPLIDPEIIDQVLEKHFSEKNDYTASAYVETFPDGLDTDVFNFTALEKAWKEATLAFQREHACQYFAKNPELFKIGALKYHINLSHKRWTLDEPGDYEFMKAVYNGLGAKKHFGMHDVLSFLEKNPHLEKLNHHIERNEGLRISFEKDKKRQIKKIISLGRSLPDAVCVLSGGTSYSKRKGYYTPGYDESDFTGLPSGAKYRVIAAFEIGKLFKQIKLVTTGKLVTHGDRAKINYPSDAKVMAQELEKLGIPPKRILLEEESSSTLGGILEIMKLAQAKGFKRIGILTSRYHAPRVKMMYEHLTKLGIEKKELNIAKKFCKNASVVIISAEDITDLISPRYKANTLKFEKSVGYRNRVQSEQKGIKDIVQGKYKVRR